ncbi:NitT/TauT family transport system substrate-binding protein [Sulfobacillus thermosulfidooxidans DSM 9293]|uniref:NitT/TauT family transport system substrate-binding protein n=1 Tax=Sulfobacillus thermosulfidooxidans (strain DSM 9293 / VKM B-1269 / AT-1) TaxID=929705 RepID=A0A1W1WFD3_SULTA|nr:ABC transporter substrate-binding protein [Sulfobacillus thermosulfidooxidans]SMC04976.1 NitT/TauT family transport system substrate-binding protein [Sulfobacillus thermosulfidooxidans DSM 9293]
MRMNARDFGVFAVLSSLIASLLTGCGQNAAKNSAPTPSTTLAKTAIHFPGGSVKPLAHPITVYVADDKDPAGAGIMLANALGYFKQLGIRIKLETFNSGADEFNSLAANQIDVARGLISAAFFNSYSQGLPVYLVADGGHNLPGRPYFALVLRKSLQGRIKTYSQLKGLKIGLVSFGNVNQLYLDRALAKGHLTNHDVHLVVVDSFSDLVTAMGNGAVDGAMLVEPDIYRATSEGIGFVFKDPTQYAPREEASTLMFSSNFVKDTPVARRFILAYLEGVRYFDTHFVYSHQGENTVLKIISQDSGDPVSLLTHINPAGLSPYGTFSVAQVQQDENWYQQYGTVTHNVPATKLVNLSFVKWADKILGPYHYPKHSHQS